MVIVIVAFQYTNTKYVPDIEMEDSYATKYNLGTIVKYGKITNSKSTVIVSYVTSKNYIISSLAMPTSIDEVFGNEVTVNLRGDHDMIICLDVIGKCFEQYDITNNSINK